MAKRKAQSPFVGRWQIVSMTEWDEDYLNEEVQAFIQFDANGMGKFQFGYVRGVIDYREKEREGQPAVEWTWEGNDESDSAMGRGWATLKDDEMEGEILFHEGDDSGFTATKQSQ